MRRYSFVAMFLVPFVLVSRPGDAAVIMAGIDTVNSSTANFHLTINGPFYPGGFDETIQLNSGAFDIARQIQQGNGDGGVDDFIDTEIVSLTLTGISSFVGPITVRIGSANGVQQSPTLGQITAVRSDVEGTVNVVGPESFISGDSLFDVFFEVDVAGMTFYNKEPHPLEAPGITELPPLTNHLPPPDSSVALYMRVGQFNDSSDPVVGSASGNHNTTPEPTSLIVWSLLGTLGIATGWRRRQRTT